MFAASLQQTPPHPSPATSNVDFFSAMQDRTTIFSIRYMQKHKKSTADFFLLDILQKPNIDIFFPMFFPMFIRQPNPLFSSKKQLVITVSTDSRTDRLLRYFHPRLHRIRQRNTIFADRVQRYLQFRSFFKSYEGIFILAGTKYRKYRKYRQNKTQNLDAKYRVIPYRAILYRDIQYRDIDIIQYIRFAFLFDHRFSFFAVTSSSSLFM